MENVKYNIFDLFSYAFPGFLVVSSVTASIYSDQFCAKEFYLVDFLKSNLDLYTGILFIIICYVGGFLSNFLGRYYLKLYNLIFFSFKPSRSTLNNSAKFVLVRELTPANFKYIERWNSLKAMCANFAFVILISSIILLVFLPCFKILFFLLGIILSFIFIIIASEFHRWAKIDLDNTVGLFNLEAKAKETKEK